MSTSATQGGRNNVVDCDFCIIDSCGYSDSFQKYNRTMLIQHLSSIVLLLCHTVSIVICCCASYPASDTMKDQWLFSMDVIREALSSTGHDVSRLSAPFAGRPSALGNYLSAFILQFWFTNLLAAIFC